MISVCICTYNRPALLQKCIESVINQKTDIPYEILVIDNDEHQSARVIVKKFTHDVKYFHQPLKGLSNARNMAVSVSERDFILFIDDDEFADENWISKILECQIQYRADVVLGDVQYLIPDEFPSYIKNSSFFQHKKRKTGEEASYNEGYTGNTLVRSSLFKLRTPPFLKEFNHTGGEDSNFINFLLSKNLKIVFSGDATIYEIQDERRLKTSWYFKRGFRGGYNYSSDLFNSKKSLKAILELMISLMGGIVLSIFLAVLSVILTDKYYLKMISKMGSQMGKISYFLGYQIYGY